MNLKVWDKVKRLPIDKKINAAFSSLAFTISVIALIFSIKSCCDTNKYRQLSFKPLLNIRVDEDCGTYGLFITNQGNGPAIVESCELFFYGGEIKSLKELSDSIFSKQLSKQPVSFAIQGASSLYNKDFGIRVGEKILICGVQGNAIFDNKLTIDETLKHLSLRIIYSSIDHDKDSLSFQK